MKAGRYEVPVNLAGLANGVYVYRLELRPDAALQAIVSKSKRIIVVK